MGLFAVGFKWTVIGGINFFLCLASIGLITFGGILSNKLPGSLELGGTMGLKAPIYLIIIGVFTLMLTFPGCYGTFRQNHCLLYMYGGMMGVVFVILLSGSITIFNFQGLIFPEMKTAARAELNNYNQTNHSTSTVGWDTFHKTLGCCGVESYTDWFGTTFYKKTGGAPASCCKEVANCEPAKLKFSSLEEKPKAEIYTTGCVSRLQNILKNKKILIGISSFVILIGFFLAVVTSCNLARDMCEENMAKDPKYHRMKVRKMDNNGVWKLVTDYDTVETPKWTCNCAIL